MKTRSEAVAAALLDLPPRPATSARRPGRVLDLYQRRFEGTRLHPGEFVICADEKPRSRRSGAGSTRRCRRLPGRRGQRVEHELRARRARSPTWPRWDVPGAPTLFDRCEPKGGIEPFDRLVEQVMTQRALRIRPPRLLDRRQRLLPSRPALDRAARGPLAEPRPRPPAGPRQLAQPDRDLLLDRPAQAAPAQRLRRPHRPRSHPQRLRAATGTRSPSPSSGTSPATTSPH